MLIIKMRIILGSKSKDRKRLFEKIDVKVEIIVSNVDERKIPIQKPDQYVKNLSHLKLHAVKEIILQNNRVSDPFIIITADTMLLLDGELIGKAKNYQDAISILTRLSGRTHEALTGVTLYNSILNVEAHIIERTFVHFMELSLSDIEDYLTKTDEYIGRAGAYSFNDRANLFIDHIEGCPTNIMGLPMAKIFEQLKEWGISLLQ